MLSWIIVTFASNVYIQKRNYKNEQEYAASISNKYKNFIYITITLRPLLSAH